MQMHERWDLLYICQVTEITFYAIPYMHLTKTQQNTHTQKIPQSRISDFTPHSLKDLSRNTGTLQSR